ncbi:MAG: UvrD-helicase domain-containing protein, partial [Candidatus Puniceispirillaceae bacterium]
SFCQSLLRRFPIEAGVAPHVKLAEDDEQNRLKAVARANVLGNPTPELGAAILLIAETIGEARIEEIVNDLLNRSEGLDAPDCLARIDAHFRDELGVVDATISRTRLADELAQIDDERLRAVSAVLQASGVPTQQERGAKMDVWLAQDAAGRIDKWSFLVDALFSKGRQRASFSNPAIRKIMPDIDVIQQQVADRLRPLLIDQAAQICRDRTMALYQFGTAFHKEYNRLKAQRGLLDYNDLITRTNDLLAMSEASQWVAWKLDNGIHHLLIDEAQDTSPAQWKLLRRLVDEFFDGEGAAHHKKDDQDPGRTMFAVGDFKQSIYSFQGADPAVMNQNRSDNARRA